MSKIIRLFKAIMWEWEHRNHYLPDHVHNPYTIPLHKGKPVSECNPRPHKCLFGCVYPTIESAAGFSWGYYCKNCGHRWKKKYYENR